MNVEIKCKNSTKKVEAIEIVKNGLTYTFTGQRSKFMLKLIVKGSNLINNYVKHAEKLSDCNI